jgi:hypothetical protein
MGARKWCRLENGIKRLNFKIFAVQKSFNIPPRKKVTENGKNGNNFKLLPIKIKRTRII